MRVNTHFGSPKKDRFLTATWPEVVDAVRKENPEAYIIRADGPEHEIAKTSLAASVPQTFVTIPKELLDQLKEKQKTKGQPATAEEQQVTSPNDNPLETDDGDGDADHSDTSDENRVETNEHAAEESYAGDRVRRIKGRLGSG